MTSKYKVELVKGWDKHFKKFDKSVQKQIFKRLKQLETKELGRHLRHWLNYFVEEFGQYRILYFVHKKTKVVVFIGTHKQYEQWYRNLE